MVDVDARDGGAADDGRAGNETLFAPENGQFEETEWQDYRETPAQRIKSAVAVVIAVGALVGLAIGGWSTAKHLANSGGPSCTSTEAAQHEALASWLGRQLSSGGSSDDDRQFTSGGCGTAAALTVTTSLADRKELDRLLKALRNDGCKLSASSPLPLTCTAKAKDGTIGVRVDKPVGDEAGAYTVTVSRRVPAATKDPKA